MNIIDIVLFAVLIAACPVGIWIFGRVRVTWEGIRDRIDRYWYHILILAAIYILKSSLIYFERAMEPHAIDFTPMIHEFEGNHVFWIQHALENQAVTVFMAAIYLVSFLFIMVFSLALFCYMDMKKAASKLAFLYIVMFFITAPIYLFVLVYVPSYPKMLHPGAGSIIAGMEPLMYNIHPAVNEFFMDYDSFNNCFPSLHIGYPLAILMSLKINVKGFRAYKYFVFAMIVLTSLAIIYLGIHWLTDILGGFLFAVIGVMIAERYAHGFWKQVHGFDMRIKKLFPFLAKKW